MLELQRPTLPEDALKEMTVYLSDHYDRSMRARQLQVDSDYLTWDQDYNAEPNEAVRHTPWRGASNFVVPISRMYIDTFTARTLGTIFGTQPLFVSHHFPVREQRDAVEAYMNLKALQEWNYYDLCEKMLHRGNKNGTVLIKQPWITDQRTWVGPNGDEPITLYDGPKPEVVPFDDFWVYPITAENIHAMRVKFHRIRYTKEEAKDKIESGEWVITTDQLETALKIPYDIARRLSEIKAGIQDNFTRELQIIECHYTWRLGGRNYDMIALFQPDLNELVDWYFNPYPPTAPPFEAYVPFPRENLFFGVSMCGLLSQAQEETSAIHNDRRNNSFLANCVMFKRRNNALVPNPSTEWYPSKVWDLEKMDDLEIFTVGRNANAMIEEEQFTIQLSERLLGQDPLMQGSSSGFMGKRGVYSSQGTMAIMSESNSRQSTNQRKARVVLTRVGKTSFILQRTFGEEDPAIALLPEAMQGHLRDAFKWATQQKMLSTRFEIKASDAAANKEVTRQNLLQLMGVIGQYSGNLMQMVTQLANPELNPTLRLIYNDLVDMSTWMVSRIMKAFDELDPEGILPDARAAIEATVPGGGRGTKEEAPGANAQGDQGALVPGENPNAAPPLSRAGLSGMAELLASVPTNGSSNGMGDIFA